MRNSTRCPLAERVYKRVPIKLILDFMSLFGKEKHLGALYRKKKEQKNKYNRQFWKSCFLTTKVFRIWAIILLLIVKSDSAKNDRSEKYVYPTINMHEQCNNKYAWRVYL